MPQGQPRVHFLSLPLEIRLCIYDHVYISTCSIHISLYYWWSKNVTPSLRTCRQIYNEACPIFYSRNTFELNVPHILSWVERIGPVNTKLLKSVLIQIRECHLYEPHDGAMERRWFTGIFSQLAREATGLRQVDTALFLDDRDVDIGRTLAKIYQLHINLQGDYGENWPRCSICQKDGCVVTRGLT